MTISNSGRAVSGALFACAIAMSAPAQASDLSKTPNDAELRIAIAEQNRLLVDRMARAACFVGIERYRTQALVDLETASIAYERFHRSFAPGRLGSEDVAERTDVFASWQESEDIWNILRPAYSTVLDTQTPVNPHLYAAATKRLSKTEEQIYAHARQIYGEGAGLTDLSRQILVDLYGRERIQMERIARASCALSLNQDPNAAIEDLSTAVTGFETTLGALRNGAPTLGIIPPPTGPVKEALEQVATEWATINADLRAVTDSGEITDARLDDILVGTVAITRALDTVSSRLALTLRPQS